MKEEKFDTLGWNLVKYISSWQTESHVTESLKTELNECRKRNEYLECVLCKTKVTI